MLDVTDDTRNGTYSSPDQELSPPDLPKTEKAEILHFLKQ